ncbi:hypothetical protein [Ensifer soli]|uniref:hypothetical protein n=1 Tax=Ciceribacter sp. sgz301302 TaxID=3342379 RepID=UPI0035B903D9
MERSKIVLAEKLGHQAEPKGKFEDQLEPALTFLANPWKLWKTGNIALRSKVLRLAFADRIEYCRKQSPRTPKIAMPFKALTGQTDLKNGNGADDGTRTRTLSERQIFVPLRLSPPPFGVRGLDCPFAMAKRGFRRRPSSLYTFPFKGLGSGSALGLPFSVPRL